MQADVNAKVAAANQFGATLFEERGLELVRAAVQPLACVECGWEKYTAKRILLEVDGKHLKGLFGCGPTPMNVPVGAIVVDADTDEFICAHVRVGMGGNVPALRKDLAADAKPWAPCGANGRNFWTLSGDYVSAQDEIVKKYSQWSHTPDALFSQGVDKVTLTSNVDIENRSLFPLLFQTNIPSANCLSGTLNATSYQNPSTTGFAELIPLQPTLLSTAANDDVDKPVLSSYVSNNNDRKVICANPFGQKFNLVLYNARNATGIRSTAAMATVGALNITFRVELLEEET